MAEFPNVKGRDQHVAPRSQFRLRQWHGQFGGARRLELDVDAHMDRQGRENLGKQRNALSAARIEAAHGG